MENTMQEKKKRQRIGLYAALTPSLRRQMNAIMKLERREQKEVVHDMIRERYKKLKANQASSA